MPRFSFSICSLLLVFLCVAVRGVSAFSLTTASPVVKNELAAVLDKGTQYDFTEDEKSGMHPAKYLVNKADFTPYMENVKRVVETGKLFRYANKNPADNECACLEKEFQNLFGFDHALSLNSCSSAILLGLISMGLKPGDKVLMPAFTFVAVPSAVVWAQGEVVLCEIDDNYALDLDDLEKKIEETGSRFLLMSYMRGHVPDMDRLKAIIKKYDLKVLEDCAHALGVEWKGEQLGKIGQCAAFSFQSNKIVDAGEGGILATNDPEIMIKSTLLAGCYEANILKHYDLEPYRDMVDSYLGTLAHFNFRMSNLQAAMIKPQLVEVEERTVLHNENYEVIDWALDQTEMQLCGFEPHTRPSLDSLQIQLNGLTEPQLRRFLELCGDHKIPMGGFLDNNARAFWNWKFLGEEACAIERCPKTYDIVRRAVDLRLPHHMTKAQNFDMCMRLNAIYRQAKQEA
uniref:Aminotransferase class I/classII domain-containing protein n=1 Tax=Heterosigma akashiwo TaxID=2829 RepID=A0A6V1XH19_HETAK|mmetsp:Transcript_42379/g.62292  ORF Transcript_42379/g.62292 Transcript_42379/m.62292 type:complete len:457 (+) Transcript_42379:119-1489(+)